MKVLHVVWSLHFGGIEKLVFDLMKFQKDQNNLDASLLVGQREGEFVTLFEQHALKTYNLGLKSGLDWRLKKLKEALNIMRSYDVIHFHSFNPLMALAAIKSKKKIMYTIHGGFGFGRKRRFNDRILELLKIQFLKCEVDLISSNSNFTKSIAISRFGLHNHSNLFVIYNGIDIQQKRDDARKQKVDPELKLDLATKFVIGTVGRFAGFKRIDRLIKAFAKMRNKENCRLLLVGNGPLRKDLESLVEKEGVANLTRFTSYQENVSPFQDIMDVCVYPSKNEPFGLVAVESLALGKMVLVFDDGGGLNEVVGRYSEKMIVSTVEELGHRLDSLYENRKEVNQDSKAVKKYAEQFAIEKMGNAFSEAYESVMRNGK